MPIAVGTVSTRGWARTAKEKIRELMNHYTESGFSQSMIYQGNVKSMAKAQQMYSQDPDGLANQIKSDLASLYGAVFPEGVEVQTSWEFLEGSDIRYRINISLRVMQNGEWIDTERYVETENSTVEDES